MRDFNYFVRKIPPDNFSQARAVFSKNIALFIPETYVTNLRMDVEEYHFVVFFSTPPRATIGGQDYQFKKGSLVGLAPGDDILVHSSGGSSSAGYMTVCVLPEFMVNIYRVLGGEGTLKFKSLSHRYSYLLLEALDALIHEVQCHDGVNPFMLSCLESRIAVQLLRDAEGVPQAPCTIRNDLEEIVQKACRYIETYCTSNITIKDVSAAIYVSPPYLQRIFPKVIGKTPHQYMMECRHQKARQMLVQTSVTMEEVARQCGFVNNAHFSTTFKNLEGVSPSSFRKSHGRAE